MEDVTIVAEQLTLVTLTLQALSSSPSYSNEAPVIDSVVASPLVAPGGQVPLTATAHDVNPGDTLAYAWTAPAGSFATPTVGSTSWTAPPSPGPVVLKLVVSDASGAASSVTLQVRVSQGRAGRWRTWASTARLWFAKEGHTHYEPPFRLWYLKKVRPSFDDMLTTLRYACLRSAFSATPRDKQGQQKPLLLLPGSLQTAA